VLRSIAVTAQSQDLGAMHAATSMQASDRVGLRPSLHRLRPLFGEIVVCNCLQRADDLAIDNTCRQRIELSRQHCNTGFVE
jgi:hypothetical protein